MKYLIFVLLTVASASSFTGCNEKESENENLSELLQLCNYKKQRTDIFLTNPCEGDIFIKRLSGEGVVKYDSTLNGYTVSSHMEGTIDCIIITLFCEDYSSLLDKEISYSCDYYEYNGFYNPPLGGTEIFVGKNINYSTK
ncbi:hypothetical protein [Bernardetia litoralis]|nr:hypothetical protein [Bernardetia litoralis]